MIVNEYDHELQNEKYRSIFGRQVKPETIAKVALGCVQEETETIQVVENTETQSEVSPEGHEDLSFDPAKLSEHASGKQTTDPDSSALPLFDKGDPDKLANQNRTHDTQDIQSPEASETSPHIPDRQRQEDTGKSDSSPHHHTPQAQGLERQFHNQDSNKSRT